MDICHDTSSEDAKASHVATYNGLQKFYKGLHTDFVFIKLSILNKSGHYVFNDQWEFLTPQNINLHQLPNPFKKKVDIVKHRLFHKAWERNWNLSSSCHVLSKLKPHLCDKC